MLSSAWWLKRRRKVLARRLRDLAAGGYYFDGVASLTSGAIASWPPLVGANALVQATGANQPTVGTLNGRKAAVFDGTNDCLQTAAFAANFSPPFTILCVCQRTALTGGTTRGLHDGIAAGNRAALTFSSADETAHQRGSLAGVNGTPSSLQPAIYREVFNGAASKHYLNSNPTAVGDTVVTSDVGTSVLSGITLAAVFNGTSNQFTGSIAAYMLIPNAADGDVRAIEAEQLLIQRYAFLRVQTVFEGDSRTAQGWPQQAAPLAAGTTGLMVGTPFANVAESGNTVAQMISQGAAQVDALYDGGASQKIAVIWGGLNDDSNGSGADYTTIHTRLATWCLARRAAGFRVIVCTEIDCQATGGLVRWHTDYPSLNTLIRNNYTTYADDIIDAVTADARFADATNAVVFNADKTHLTATGISAFAAIAASALARQAV